jgi:hypothetical protein
MSESKKISKWKKARRRIRDAIKGIFIKQKSLGKLELMTGNTSHAFYDEKDRSVPRFSYRRLQHDLSNKSGDSERAAILDNFLLQIEQEGSKGDFLKFKWLLPNYLRRDLKASESNRIEAVFAQRRHRRNRRYMDVYPHCSDEFSLDPNFFDATLGVSGAPVISKATSVFTLGSCFARNIAVFLQSQGYNAIPFPLAEDLNSPLSNAKMLSVAIAAPEKQRCYLRTWVTALSPDVSVSTIEKIVDQEITRLETLVQLIKSADFIVITVGNVFDFFITPDAGDIAPEVPVAPKFFRIAASEDINVRSSVSAKLKANGAVFRMGSFAEAKMALCTLRETIMTINPEAHCVFTLSPVPLDSAIGVEKSLPYGSIELDCISKSTLRTALNEFFADRKDNDPKLYYFPSFEIVRWIGSMLTIPAFGYEDAAARHVSSDILNAVYGYFLQKFGVPAATSINETTPPL